MADRGSVTRRRPRLVLAAVVAVCMAVTGVAVTGAGRAQPGLRFAQAGHWIYNSVLGTAFHVDGASKNVDAQIPVAGAPPGTTVVQTDRDGYVLSRDRTIEFGKSDLSVADPVKPPADEQPVGLEAAGAAFAVYQVAGKVVRFGEKPTVDSVGGRLASSVVTRTGTLWVHRLNGGQLCQLPLTATRLSCTGTTPPGHTGSLALVGDDPVFVDSTADTVSAVSGAGLGRAVRLGVDLPDSAVVAANDVSGRIAIVDPVKREVHFVDADVLHGGDAEPPISAKLRTGRYERAASSGSALALIDEDSGTLVTVDDRGRIRRSAKIPAPSKPVPAERGRPAPKAELFRGEDSRLYVDASTGEHMFVVDDDGEVSSIPVTGTDEQDERTDDRSDKPEPTDRPSERTKPADKPSVKPSDKPVARPSDKPSDKPSEIPVDKPTQPPPDQPEQPVDKPADKPSTRPTDTPTDTPTRTADRPSTKPRSTPRTTPRTTPRPTGPARTTPTPSTPPATTQSPLEPSTTPPPKPTTPAARPGAPGAVRGTAGDGTASVSWNAAQANGAPITAYQLSWAGGSRTVAASARDTTVTGLANGTAYTITVRAVNKVGTGPGASTGRLYPATTAGAVTGLNAAASDGTIALEWNQPDLNGGTLTGYRVTSSAGTRTVTSPASRWTGLTNGTRYTFTVVALTRTADGRQLTGRPASVGATPAAPPVNDSRIVVSRGEQTSYGSCKPPECAYIAFRAENLKPNTHYTFKPWTSEWGNFNTGYGTETDGNGNVTVSHQFPCDAIGQQVWIVAEGPDGNVTSNKITWTVS